MKDIEFVKGNLIFRSGDHQVKELVAYAGVEWEKIAEHITNGDLIITDRDILMPYKIYCASGDISTNGNLIGGLQTPNDVVRIYREEINNLQQLRRQKVSSNLAEVLNRQIYIGVVGTMELFLSDFLYSMVLGFRKYFNKFCENSSRTFKLKEISARQWRTQDAVIKTIIETNYHRIEDINKIYKKVLDSEFLSSKKLAKQILTRHSLVHRNGFPSKNSEYVKVNPTMINELITEVNTLVDHIIKTRQAEIEEWLPDPINKPVANN